MICDLCGRDVSERFLYLPRSFPRIGIRHSLASGKWVCARCLATEYTSTTLLYAKFYLSLGFSVIPIAYKDKKPLIAWEEFQHRKPTEEELASWFVRERRNVGIVCGVVSGNLCVLDFDSPEAYANFFPGHKDLEETTMVARTRKGYHVYLRSAESTRSTKILELKLELRSDGNYVVAPPSIHPEPDEVGREVHYRFVNPNVEDIALVDDVRSAVMKRASELGVKRLEWSIPSQNHNVLKAHRLAGRPYDGPHLPCVKALLKGVEEGRRNETCIQLASYFLTFRRLTPQQALRIMNVWNRRNKPPLPEGEIIETVDNAVKGLYPYGCDSFRDVCDPFSCPLGSRLTPLHENATLREFTTEEMSLQEFLSLREKASFRCPEEREPLECDGVNCPFGPQEYCRQYIDSLEAEDQLGRVRRGEVRVRGWIVSSVSRFG